MQIDTRCVWRSSGELVEFSEDLNDAAFSGVAEKKNLELNSLSDGRSLYTDLSRYFVGSVSLYDL